MSDNDVRNLRTRDGVLKTEHLILFGAIIVSWARLEMRLNSCIACILKCPLGQGLLVSSELMYIKKRDLMRVLGTESGWSEEDKTKVNYFLDCIDKLSKVRDKIAHKV
jgi:hypothetical protein